MAAASAVDALAIAAKSDVLEVAKELAQLVPSVQAGNLQAAVAKEALHALRQLEDQVRLSVHVVVRSLAEQEDIAVDAVWMLHKLASTSDTVVEWIRQIHGETAVLAAMRAHPENKELVMYGVWAVKALCGIRGVVALLGGESGIADLAGSVVAAAMWVINDELGKARSGGITHSPQDAERLLRLIAGQLHQHANNPSIREASFPLLNTMLADQPDLRGALVDLGTTPLLVQSLALAMTAATEDAEAAILSCARLFNMLSQGCSTQMKAGICQGDTVRVLMQLASRSEGGNASEMADPR